MTVYKLLLFALLLTMAPFQATALTILIASNDSNVPLIQTRFEGLGFVVQNVAQSQLTPPGDMVPLSELGVDWTVLATSQVNPLNVSLAVGVFGAGRIALDLENFSPNSVGPGSDIYVEQLLGWAGTAQIPEPSTGLLVTVGLALMAYGRHEAGRTPGFSRCRCPT